MIDLIKKGCKDMRRVLDCPVLTKAICWGVLILAILTLTTYKVISAIEEDAANSKTKIEVMQSDVKHIKETCDKIWDRIDK
jgi:hypothetical protein